MKVIAYLWLTLVGATLLALAGAVMYAAWAGNGEARMLCFIVGFMTAVVFTQHCLDKVR